VETRSESVWERITSGIKTQFKLVLTPKMLHMMGRMLGKIGLEILARDHAAFARSPRFNQIKRFVRFGEPTSFLWPIFYSASNGPPNPCPTEIAVFDTDGLIKGGDKYTLSFFQLGTECWIICLNDPYPHPVIRDSFPGGNLRLITY
jgi:hypothetical protein